MCAANLAGRGPGQKGGRPWGVPAGVSGRAGPGPQTTTEVGELSVVVAAGSTAGSVVGSVAGACFALANWETRAPKSAPFAVGSAALACCAGLSGWPEAPWA